MYIVQFYHNLIMMMWNAKQKRNHIVNQIYYIVAFLPIPIPIPIPLDIH